MSNEDKRYVVLEHSQFTFDVILNGEGNEKAKVSVVFVVDESFVDLPVVIEKLRSLFDNLRTVSEVMELLVSLAEKHDEVSFTVK